MKILHVLSSPHLGGAEVMCLLLAKEQTATGHEVLVHLMASGATKAYADSNEIPVILREVPDGLGKRVYWKELERSLRESITSYHPDIVHSHVPKTNLVCQRTLYKLKVPWVTTIHGSWRQFGYSPDVVKRPLLKPWLLLRHAAGDYLSTRSASKVVAISDYVRGQLLQVGVSRKKLFVVHDGLPFNPGKVSRSDARRVFNLPDDAIVIGSLGHFSPVKGFDLLIDAFARLASDTPKVILLIAGGDILGDNRLRLLLQKQITGLGMNERIRLLGPLDTRQGFFSCLDIFAVSSRTEGFSLSLVEAMQHGLPSVVTSAGGCIEAARPNKESLLFTSGNTLELAGKLKELINNPGLRDTLGRSALERARSYLTVTRCADEYHQVYMRP